MIFQFSAHSRENLAGSSKVGQVLGVTKKQSCYFARLHDFASIFSSKDSRFIWVSIHLSFPCIWVSKHLGIFSFRLQCNVVYFYALIISFDHGKMDPQGSHRDSVLQTAWMSVRVQKHRGLCNVPNCIDAHDVMATTHENCFVLLVRKNCLHQG